MSGAGGVLPLAARTAAAASTLAVVTLWSITAVTVICYRVMRHSSSAADLTQAWAQLQLALTLTLTLIVTLTVTAAVVAVVVGQ